MFLSLCMCAKSFQSCPTLCDAINYSPPSSFVYEILQAWILEWVVKPFSRGSSCPRDRTRVSCLMHWLVGSLPPAPLGKSFYHCTSVLLGSIYLSCKNHLLLICMYILQKFEERYKEDRKNQDRPPQYACRPPQYAWTVIYRMLMYLLREGKNSLGKIALIYG